VQLQPGGELMSVYYAKRQQGDGAAAAREGPGRNAKLYFTHMPAGLAREAMLKLFSQHGRVRHLQLYADDGGALTSGTVTMFSRHEAAAAMAALDGAALAGPGAPPLTVAWAQLNVLPKAQQSEVVGATVGYGCVPPGVTPHEVRRRLALFGGLGRVMVSPRHAPKDAAAASLTAAQPPPHLARPRPQVAALFQRFGPVLKVIPFPAARDGTPGARGCGRIIMAHPAHTEAAAQALSGAFTWPGAECPMVVQPLHDVPPSAAAFAGPGAMPAVPQAAGAPFARPPPAGPLAGVAHLHALAAGPGGGGGAGGAPPGCGSGAAPLVLSNLPPLTDDAQLRGLLAPYGRLAALQAAAPPPALGPGAGASAVAWFASRGEAELAAAALNGLLLASPTDPMPRQLAAQLAAPPAAAPVDPSLLAHAAGGALLGAAHWGGGATAGGAAGVSNWLGLPQAPPRGGLMGATLGGAATALPQGPHLLSDDRAPLMGLARPASAQSWAGQPQAGPYAGAGPLMMSAPTPAPPQHLALQLQQLQLPSAPASTVATPTPPRGVPSPSPHGLGHGDSGRATPAGLGAPASLGVCSGGLSATLGTLASLSAPGALTPASSDAPASSAGEETPPSAWLGGDAAAKAPRGTAPAPASAGNTAATSAAGSHESSPHAAAGGARAGSVPLPAAGAPVLHASAPVSTWSLF
jgi:hypothetical protein